MCPPWPPVAGFLCPAHGRLLRAVNVSYEIASLAHHLLALAGSCSLTQTCAMPGRSDSSYGRGDIARTTTLDRSMVSVAGALSPSASVINDILDFSKIEAEELELESVLSAFERLLHGPYADRWLGRAAEKGLQLASGCQVAV